MAQRLSRACLTRGYKPPVKSGNAFPFSLLHHLLLPISEFYQFLSLYVLRVN
jgi:hypothetical protein